MVRLTNDSLVVERLNQGKPILMPKGDGWESGVVFNSSALFLECSAQNQKTLAAMLGGGADVFASPQVAGGVVVLHYRARPQSDPGYLWARSYTGLAVFTPELELLHRWDEPVLGPSSDPQAPDYLGIEDPRITPLDGQYYMAYCGSSQRPQWKASICLARSADLVHWEKMGAVQGDLNHANNKDAVLMPERVDGCYCLLHRPMVGGLEEYGVEMAHAAALDGPWENIGKIFQPVIAPREGAAAKVGGGSVPIALGGGRFLMIYHVGHSSNPTHDKNPTLRTQCFYYLGAALLECRESEDGLPAFRVKSTFEPLLEPEVDWEVRAPFADSVGNVVFTCGTYVHQGYLYIIYGAADSYVMAARVPWGPLLEKIGFKGSAV